LVLVELRQTRELPERIEAQLEHVIALRERGRVREDADRNLVAAIATVLRDHPFTTRHVLQLAPSIARYMTALEAADITNARELGHALKRLVASLARC
jgi:hypothetical protein